MSDKLYTGYIQGCVANVENFEAKIEDRGIWHECAYDKYGDTMFVRSDGKIYASVGQSEFAECPHDLLNYARSLFPVEAEILETFDRKKVKRRIVNMIHQFATDAQVMEIAKLLNVKTE
jgi:hypothetical protein